MFLRPKNMLKSVNLSQFAAREGIFLWTFYHPHAFDLDKILKSSAGKH